MKIKWRFGLGEQARFALYTMMLARLLLMNTYKQRSIVLMFTFLCVNVNSLIPAPYIYAVVFLHFVEYTKPSFSSVFQDATCSKVHERQEIKLRHLMATDL